MRVRGFCLIVFPFWALSAYAGSVVSLGTAGTFAVLAGSTVTNTGLTDVDGNIGLWPGTSITGFTGFGAGGPGTLTGGAFYTGPGPGVAETAESDLTTAYNFAAGEACGTSLTGQDLGSVGPLQPSVYCFSSSAGLTGTLLLNDEGNPNAVFVFQIATSLTTATGSAVDFENINGGGDTGANVFWQIGSSATLGTDTAFAGNMLALTSITLDTGATIGCGSALAQNGAVTMDDNYVSISCESTATTTTPEPGTAALLGLGLLLGLIVYGLFSCRNGARGPLDRSLIYSTRIPA